MRRWLGNRFAMITAILVLLYLFLPVAYTFVFSFNNYKKSNIVWNPEGSPTLKYWKDPCGAPGVCESLVTSIEIGLIATLVSMTLGTLLAFALVRHQFRGSGAGNVLVFVPMATPEIVLGASLLTIFVQGFGRVGLGPRLLRRSSSRTSCSASASSSSRSRPASRASTRASRRPPRTCMPGPGSTFWKITFPLVLPGIIGAGLLAFSLSFDDFIITNFVSGNETTFPKFVYVSYLRGIPAQANVIGFSMFVIALSLVIIGQLVGNARKK